MKKAIALILGVALLAAALTGCGWGIRLGNGTGLGPGKLYDVNDHGEQDLSGVESIEISTVSDSVTLTAGGEKATADLKGQCRSTGDPVYLDMHKDGSTIRIDVRYPNISISCNTSLSVAIPEGYKGSLSIQTVSGGINAEGLPYELGKTDLSSVSGTIRFSTKSFAGMNASTTSGGISVSGIGANISAKSISGNIDLDFTSVADTVASSVSGGVDIRIPKDASFRIEFDTVSGGFHSSGTGLDVTNARGFTGSTGSGGPLFKVNTTSGSFTLEGK